MTDGFDESVLQPKPVEPRTPLPAYLGDDVDLVLNDPQCFSCLWFKGDGTCDAFPEGIPFDIYVNQADHRKRYPGDGGVVFKLRK